MCFYCKGEMKPGTTTHTVTFDEGIIVIKNVPCEECEQCGAVEYSNEVAQALEKIVESARKLLQEVSVIDYSKVA